MHRMYHECFFLRCHGTFDACFVVCFITANFFKCMFRYELTCVLSVSVLFGILCFHTSVCTTCVHAAHAKLCFCTFLYLCVCAYIRVRVNACMYMGVCLHRCMHASPCHLQWTDGHTFQISLCFGTHRCIFFPKIITNSIIHTDRSMNFLIFSLFIHMHMHSCTCTAFASEQSRSL